MLTYWKCTITVTVDDDDVRESLGVEDSYEPSYDDRKNYAWECIENGDCEYGTVELD